jgi:hypothetical protein
MMLSKLVRIDAGGKSSATPKRGFYAAANGVELMQVKEPIRVGTWMRRASGTPRTRLSVSCLAS